MDFSAVLLMEIFCVDPACDHKAYYQGDGPRAPSHAEMAEAFHRQDHDYGGGVRQVVRHRPAPEGAVLE